MSADDPPSNDPEPGGDADWYARRVYDELRRLAARHMRGERGDHTLQPTALVHEVYVRLSDYDAGFRDRTHFLAVAAGAMRRVLVDHARSHRSEKRGGGAQKVTLDLDRTPSGQVAYDILDLHQALATLADLHERRARVVELRFFGGLEVKEVAELLEVSPRTVIYDSNAACAWLASRLEEPEPGNGAGVPRE